MTMTKDDGGMTMTKDDGEALAADKLDAIAKRAATWWANDLVDETKRAAFRAASAPIFAEIIAREGAEYTRLGYVDYDPDKPLLAVLRAIGVECSGMLFSARRIFAYSKTGLMVIDGVLCAKADHGAPWEPLPADLQPVSASTPRMLSTKLATDAGATCADVATPPILDVAALSVGLADGIYYAGRRLTPWLTFNERQRLSTLEPSYARGGKADLQARYVELRTRRAGESLLVRWEIEGARTNAPLSMVDKHREVDGLDSRDGKDIDRSYVWGRGIGHVDVYRLGHELLRDLIGNGGAAARRDRSSNAYIDAVMKLLADLGDEWVIAQRDLHRIVIEQDIVVTRAKLGELEQEAAEHGFLIGNTKDGEDVNHG